MYAAPASVEPPLPHRRGQSSRPALTQVVLLAAANPGIVERLLSGEPPDAALQHPQYTVPLDALDRATLTDICAQARTVHEFLVSVAAAADGIAG